MQRSDAPEHAYRCSSRLCYMLYTTLAGTLSVQNLLPGWGALRVPAVFPFICTFIYCTTFNLIRKSSVLKCTWHTWYVFWHVRSTIAWDSV